MVYGMVSSGVTTFSSKIQVTKKVDQQNNQTHTQTHIRNGDCNPFDNRYTIFDISDMSLLD